MISHTHSIAQMEGQVVGHSDKNAVNEVRCENILDTFLSCSKFIFTNSHI